MVIRSSEILSFSVGDTRNATVSFSRGLDTGVTLSNPLVVEQTTSDLTIGSKAINTSTVSIEENATTTVVAIGQAVQFTISGGTQANSPYLVRCTATSSTSEIIVFDQQVEFC